MRFLSLALSLILLSPARAQDVGEEPLPLAAKTWLNYAGAPPSLAELRGRTVMVHFFRMKDITTKAHFNLMRRFHHDHADKGLVILGMTDAPLARVEEYMAKDNLPFAVGVGTEMFDTWRVPSDFHQVTLGTDGLIYARGPSNSMWNGKLLKGLKGADRLGERACLRLVPDGDFGRGSAKTLRGLEQGELAKALKTVEGQLAKDTTTPETRAAAQRIQEAVQQHVEQLMEQLERNLERRDVLLVEAVLDGLTDDLARHALGQAARDRREELGRDEDFQLEVEAAHDFEKLMVAYYKRGYSKNVARAEKLMEKYPDTRAAEKTRNWYQQRSL
ncbi:MAG: hypothetical protein GY711_01935 [bacterium]|nr:hypothetical protein [bacterium]